MSVSSYESSFVGEVYDDVICFMWLQPIEESPEFVMVDLDFKYIQKQNGAF